VLSITRPSALVAAIPSSHVPNVRLTFALVAESRSLVLVNASILFGASNAKRRLLAIVQKARDILP
jgi:hypothetical protein